MTSGFDLIWDAVTQKAAHFVKAENVQDKEEMRALACIVQDIRCDSYLEIGTSFGLSLSMFGPIDGRIVCVDYFTEPAASVAYWVMEKFYATHTIKGDSHKPDIVDTVTELGPFDVVFIDAGHEYKDVKLDYENYGHLATKLLLFHDIQQPGVRKFWNEIGGGLEIINKGSTKGYGVRFVC